jgi:hypothetical protein
MFGPDGEVVGIESEFLLKILDDGGVFEEEHGASPARKLPLILASLWGYSAALSSLSSALTMSHSLWCCSPNRMTARELWELNEEGCA